MDHVERVVVCNVRGKGSLENKSDRIDADGLSEKLRLGGLQSVFHGAPEILTLKELVRNYNNLVEDSTRVMQQPARPARTEAGPRQLHRKVRPRVRHDSGVRVSVLSVVRRNVL